MGGVRGSSLSTICAWCNRVRSRAGEWRETERTDLGLSPATHGICPDCLEKATAHATMSAAAQ